MMNHACVGCSAAFGTGCIECDSSNYCTNVQSGYFVSKGFSFSCDILPDPPELPLATCCKTKDLSKCLVTRSYGVRGDNDNKTISIYYNENSVSINCSKMTAGCKYCTAGEDGEAPSCTECEEGYVLFGGTCKTCSDHISNGNCLECGLEGCLTCDGDSLRVSGDGKCVACERSDEVFEESSRICMKCNSLYSQCSQCDATGCTDCSANVLHEGLCKTCKAIHGNGCKTCSNMTCSDCQDDGCCTGETKIVTNDAGERSCGTCAVYGIKCTECTERGCTSCEEGHAVIDNKCVECSELYDGCGKCDSDICVECADSAWSLTDNGCFDRQEVIIISPSSSSSSSASVQPVQQKSSVLSSESDAGLIVGIVVACVVVLAIVGAVIYLVVSSGPKHGKVNAEFVDEEEGENYISMSVL